MLTTVWGCPVKAEVFSSTRNSAAPSSRPTIPPRANSATPPGLGLPRARTPNRVVNTTTAGTISSTSVRIRSPFHADDLAGLVGSRRLPAQLVHQLVGAGLELGHRRDPADQVVQLLGQLGPAADPQDVRLQIVEGLLQRVHLHRERLPGPFDLQVLLEPLLGQLQRLPQAGLH